MNNSLIIDHRKKSLEILDLDVSKDSSTTNEKCLLIVEKNWSKSIETSRSKNLATSGTVRKTRISMLITKKASLIKNLYAVNNNNSVLFYYVLTLGYATMQLNA